MWPEEIGAQKSLKKSSQKSKAFRIKNVVNRDVLRDVVHKARVDYSKGSSGRNLKEKWTAWLMSCSKTKKDLPSSPIP